MTPELRRRAKAIFHDALELPLDERAALVSNRTNGDAALAAAVHELLAAHHEAGEFLGRPTLGPDSRADGDGAPTRLDEERPGARIGRYRLISSIGQGGFGSVWMAEQVEPVRRRVALKVIKLGMDTKAVVARFEAERQALALMDHESIARVFDAGATDAGRPYFVMELVDGVPITRYCEQHGLSVNERLAIFVVVCRAVQHAHQKGVIHRDIKPGNVLVTRHDGRALPKVIDFGIAKATSARLTEATMFTEFRQVIGTPEYMAPEQAEASGIDVDTRADVYSLGVLLYELLTGETPFDLASMREKSWDEVLRTIREIEPAKPSTRVSTRRRANTAQAPRDARDLPPRLSGELRRRLSGDLDWIVMKALEKDRSRRYETALALAEDVERHLQHLPVLAGPPSRTYQLAKLVRRHRVAFASATIVFAALVIGVVTATYGLFEARDQRARAESKERAASAELRTRTRVARFLSDMLRGAGPAVAQGRDATILREILANTRRSLDQELGGDGQDPSSDAVRATLLDVMGQVHREIGDVDEAVRLCGDSVALRRRLHPDGHVDLAVAETNYSLALHASGRFEEAESHAREALRVLASLPAAPTAERVLAHNNLGAVLLTRGRMSEAEAQFRESLRLAGETHARDSAEACIALDNLGELERQRGNLDAAADIASESLERIRAAFGEDHPRTLTAENNLAAVWTDAGRLEDAARRLEMVLERARRVHGDRSAIVALTLENLGLAHSRLRHDERALTCFEEAIAIDRTLPRGDGEALARALCRRGRTLIALKRKTDARSSIEEGLAIYARLPPADRRDEAEGLADRATLHQEAGRLQDAEADLRRAVEIATRVDPASHQTGTLRNALGGLWFDLGRPHEAATEVGVAYAILKNVPHADAVEVATVSGNLALTLLRSGDLEGAERTARESLEQRRALGADHPLVRDAAYWLAEIVGRRGNAAEAARWFEEAVRFDLTAAGSDTKRVANVRRNVSLRAFEAGAYAWGRDQVRMALAIDDTAPHDLSGFGSSVALLSAFDVLLGEPRLQLERVRECVAIARATPKESASVSGQELLLALVSIEIAHADRDLAIAREGRDAAESAWTRRRSESKSGDWRLRWAAVVAAAARAQVTLLEPADAAGSATEAREAILETARVELERELPGLIAGDLPQPVRSLRLPTVIEALSRVHGHLEETSPGRGHAAEAKRWRDLAVDVRKQPLD